MLLRVLPVVMMVAVAAANAGTAQVDVAGEYTSNWEDVTLVQEGNYVHGTYVCCGGGTIDGRIYEGRVIRYHWKQAGGAEGEGVWEIAGDRLEGTWGTNQSDDDGGRWDLVRKSSLAN
jgi:hypothetical protein